MFSIKKGSPGFFPNLDEMESSLPSWTNCNKSLQQKLELQQDILLVSLGIENYSVQHSKQHYLLLYTHYLVSSFWFSMKLCKWTTVKGYLYPFLPLVVLSMQLSDVETSSKFNTGNANLQKLHSCYLRFRFIKIILWGKHLDSGLMVGRCYKHWSKKQACVWQSNDFCCRVKIIVCKWKPKDSARNQLNTHNIFKVQHAAEKLSWSLISFKRI